MSMYLDPREIAHLLANIDRTVVALERIAAALERIGEQQGIMVDEGLRVRQTNFPV